MSPSKRIPRPRRDALLRALRAQDTAEARAVREQLALLAQLRRTVLAEIAGASGYRSFHLTAVLQSIDGAIAEGRAAAEALARGEVAQAFAIGRSSVDGVISAGVRDVVLHDVSSELLHAAIDVTTDSLRSIWNELGAGLKTAIRRAAVGATDPFLAMQMVARRIVDVKSFGTAQARAETIVRTELNRTFSLATRERMKQANKALGGQLRKWWLTAGDDRVRDSHLEAGERYAPGGKPGPIPVDEAFKVGDAELMEPLDPHGPAEETINCRCRAVPYVEHLAAAA